MAPEPDHHDDEHRHDHGHGHGHGEGHGHGHEHDRGVKAMFRYLRHAPEMWRSEVNNAVVARIAPQVGETVMDVGAGAGAGTMVAAERGCTVVSIEPTPYMRRVLRLRCLLRRVGDRVRIVDAAAEATTLEAGSIDAAWAVNTMHHWTDLEAGIAELVRVLAPGGRMLLVDEDFDAPANPDFESFGAKRQEEHRHEFHTVDPDVVSAALSAAGVTASFAGRQAIVGRPAIIIEATTPAE